MKRGGYIARRTPLRRNSGPFSGLRRSRLAVISYRRKRQMDLYWKVRNEYLRDHPWDEIAPQLWETQLPAEEVHHRRGRIGILLNDKRFFLAVSRISHLYIHNHPDVARAKGWILS